MIEPVGESWPDWKIWSELGRRMGYGEYFPWKTDEEVTEHMLAPCGVSFKNLKTIPWAYYFPGNMNYIRRLGLQQLQER